MSIHTVVFVPDKTLLPCSAKLAQQASSAGYQLEAASDFDPQIQNGFLPVTCDGMETGFEYFCDPISDYLDEVGSEFSFLQRWRMRRFEVVADFVTHSGHDERYAAIIAAASFAVAANGLLLDCNSGRFIPSKRAFRWARRVAEPPDPEQVSKRREIAKLALNHAWTILEPLGYSKLDRAPDKSDLRGSKWFVRRGSAFRNEMVEVSVAADADQSFLVVSFFGSPFPIEKLRRDGLSGNAAGRYLNQYHFYILERPYEAVLPQNILIDENFLESEEARRLTEEIREADEGVFEELRAGLEEDGHVWPEAP